MPFTSAFCISIIFSWPLIISSCCTIYLIIYLLVGNKIVLRTYKPLIIITLFLLCTAFSFFINNIIISSSYSIFSKAQNHFFAYFASIINFYISSLFFLNINKKSNDTINILKTITGVLFFSSTLAIVEFISKNLLGIDFDKIIPHPSVEKMNALALGDIFKSIRARGLAEEPGHFAFMINLFLPISFYYLFFSGYCKLKIQTKILMCISFALALLFTFSTAAFFALPTSIFLSFIVFRRELKKYLLSITIVFCAFIGFILILDNYFPILTQLLLDIDQKANNSGSMDDRSMRSYLFQSYFGKAPILNKIIGYGPSGYLRAGLEADSESFLVLYQTLTFETGILGILIFSSFLYTISLYARKLPFPFNFFLFLSFILGIVHYFFISNYWYPWFWFICAFITHLNSLRKDD